MVVDGYDLENIFLRLIKDLASLQPWAWLTQFHVMYPYP